MILECSDEVRLGMMRLSSSARLVGRDSPERGLEVKEGAMSRDYADGAAAGAAKLLAPLQWRSAAFLVARGIHGLRAEWRWDERKTTPRSHHDVRPQQRVYSRREQQIRGRRGRELDEQDPSHLREG